MKKLYSVLVIMFLICISFSLLRYDSLDIRYIYETNFVQSDYSADVENNLMKSSIIYLTIELFDVEHDNNLRQIIHSDEDLINHRKLMKRTYSNYNDSFITKIQD